MPNRPSRPIALYSLQGPSSQRLLPRLAATPFVSTLGARWRNWSLSASQETSIGES